MTSFKKCELFGGAITVDLPATFGDVSNIRQVPDNQEVYLDSDGFTSVIVDITQRVEGEHAPTDVEALLFHFKDIVSGTSDVVRKYEPGTGSLEKMPTHPLHTLRAHMIPSPSPSPRRPETPDITVILVLLLRLPEQKTDIVISVNVPYIPGHYVPAEVDLEAGRGGPLLERGLAVVERVRGSFEVRDWGLFVEE
ncbi:Mog1p/PsbP-like protein [Patellaria atrata CBS 101060]|uniref:Mog1p/PsbP-like protein n=1 Tax=Patellaria atrata CBS 101060 TaxID=1346257 RepID=A0A9P4S9J1_9PEZI|nr:Mog1p/PsbP-like protein [Patellaria atrata CBS 101060]